jgi:hypothetical protein
MPRIALFACVGALVLSGCGGSTKSAETSAGTTTGTTTAATVAAKTPLTVAEWNSYVADRDKARSINASATKTFATCRQLILSTAPAAQVQSCLKNSTTDVVDAGKTALTQLEALSGQGGSACQAANASLTNYVKLYTASIQSLSVSVDRGDLASAQSSIDNGIAALKHSRAASVAFEAACKPPA